MNNGRLFNSLDRPVPPVRRNLQLIPIQHNGNNLLIFHDLLGYTPGNFALDSRAEPVLSLINGRLSIRQISHTLEGKISSEDLLDFVRLLDQNCVLETDFYMEKAGEKEDAFESSPVRPAALAGETYPSDPSELRVFLDEIMESDLSYSENTSDLKALYAPHIDPNVGAKVYGSAFSRLRNLRPERVVILATAHYPGYYPSQYQNIPFIGTGKTFELPSASINSDVDFLEEFKKTGQDLGFTVRDRAHRIEHSIELHLLFTSHIWNHDFRIVPILVNSFDELLYMEDGDLGQKLNQFSSKLRELDDESTFYLISGDLSHVGRKFGDREPADSLRPEVSEFDNQFIDLASANKPAELLKLMRSNYDRYRICGFPPLYTFLKTFPGLKGRQIDYSWWDEKERESAVSFGAIGYSV